MSFFQEFKQFALRGNVIDLAVAFIMGAAFQKIVDSSVKDLIMPLIGRLVGNHDFSEYYLPLAGQDWHLPLAKAQEKGAVFAYGSFLTVSLQFLIVAFAVFLLVKAINAAQRAFRAEAAAREAAAPPPEPAPQEKLLAEIRDLLKARNDSAPKLGS